MEKLIATTIDFVKKELQENESGHNFFHIQRVFNNACFILEFHECDQLVVKLAALLHDIADSKFHNGDETIGPKIARDFLNTQGVRQSQIDHIVKIIENISFKGLKNTQDFKSIELDIVQDADRLDALGAIGIARTFNYGGFKNREIYDPAIKPNLDQTVLEYKNSNSPTINHFYEKLLLLKDKFNTEKGKELAESRHQFLEIYLEEFFKEWNFNNQT